MTDKPDAQPAEPSGPRSPFTRRRVVAAVAILVLLAVPTTLSIIGSQQSAPPAETGEPFPSADSTTVPPEHTIAENFPSADTTGVPEGTNLTDYTGPCEISTPGTVIDAKRVDCWPLQINAEGVVITRSLIDGFVYAGDDGTGSFTITDTDVQMGDYPGTGIGDARFTATRVHVTGGKRSVSCFRDCTVEHSYVHRLLPRIRHPDGVQRDHPRQHGCLRRARRAPGCRMLGCPHRLRRFCGGAEQRHRRQPLHRRVGWVLHVWRFDPEQTLLHGDEGYPFHQQRVAARDHRRVRSVGADHLIRHRRAGQRVEQQPLGRWQPGGTRQLSRPWRPDAFILNADLTK
jgi:hypothetical protein